MEHKTLPLTDILKGDRYRKDYGDLTELKKSIRTQGLINPIAVMKTLDGYELAAGGRRLQSITELGWTEVEVRVYSGDEFDLRSIELAENIFRKELEFSEKVALEKRLHELQQEKFGAKTQGQRGNSGWSIEDTAKLIGISDKVLREDLKLAAAIEEIPELSNLENKAEALRAYTKLQEEVLLAEISKRRQAQAKAKGSKLSDSYIVGDFLRCSKSLKDGSFDFIDADPPYGVSYNTLVDDWKDDWSDWDEATYRAKFPRYVKEFYRLLSPTGWLIVWLASRNLDTTIGILEDNGFKPWRVPAVWIKTPGSCVQPKVQLKNAYEPFLYAHKGNGQITSQGSPNVLMYSQESKRIHQAEKPRELMKAVLSTFGHTGDRVLIPFAGSGNTILAAHELNMTAVGYDLSQKHKDKFIVRAIGGENVVETDETT